MKMIPKKYWKQYDWRNLGEVYREYAYSTDIGAVVKSDGTINLSTSVRGGNIFCEQYYDPAEFVKGKHRVVKARTANSASFYKVYAKNRPGLSFYICTYMLEGFSELPDTIIVGIKENYVDEDENKDKDKDNDNDNVKVIKDFIYKIDDSNKLCVKSQYESIDVFFSEPIANNSKLDTLLICAVDTKIPVIKLEKVKRDNKVNYIFIVDITNEYGDNFSFKSTINNNDQLKSLVEKTIEALSQYENFSKYIEDLANCL